MKTLILTLSLIFSTTLSAGYLQDRANEWTTVNTVLECSMLAVSYMDYKQTMFMSGHNWHQFQCLSKDGNAIYYYREGNPLLGQTPSKTKVVIFGISSNLSIAIIAFMFPPKYREFFQGMCIGIESANVYRNHTCNISWKHSF